MASEKRFGPTARKLKKARADGDVAKSRDFTSISVFVVGVLFLWCGGNKIASVLEFSEASFRIGADFGTENVLALLFDAFEVMFTLLVPFLILVFITSFAIEATQAGVVLSIGVLAIKFSRLNLIDGLKRMFGLKKDGQEGFSSGMLYEVMKMSIYFITLGGLFIGVLLCHGLKVIFESYEYVSDVIRIWLFESSCLVFGSIVILGLVSSIDLLLKRHSRAKRLMMDVEEFKKEMRDSEGNPEIRGMRKSLHEEVLTHGIIGNLRKAKAVIVGNS